jgi:hypothetical protein
VKRSQPEQEIQRRVFEHLRSRGERGVFAFHVPNGGKRALLEAVQFKKAGVVAGVPDVIAIKDGVTHALELKAGKARKPSDAQIETIKKMETAGVRVAVAHSLDEALFTLEYWGLLKRDQSQREANHG